MRRGGGEAGQNHDVGRVLCLGTGVVLVPDSPVLTGPWELRLIVCGQLVMKPSGLLDCRSGVVTLSEAPLR